MTRFIKNSRQADTEITNEVKKHVINLLAMIHTQITICEKLNRQEDEKNLRRLFTLLAEALEQYESEEI